MKVHVNQWRRVALEFGKYALYAIGVGGSRLHEQSDTAAIATNRAGILRTGSVC